MDGLHVCSSDYSYIRSLRSLLFNLIMSLFALNKLVFTSITLFRICTKDRFDIAHNLPKVYNTEVGDRRGYYKPTEGGIQQVVRPHLEWRVDGEWVLHTHVKA